MELLQEVRVLLVEDDQDDVLLTREYLSESRYFKFFVDWEPNVEKAKEKLTQNNIDICLIDYRLGMYSGLDLIQFAREKKIMTPIILLTGQGDWKVDLEAMHFGAADYLIKSDLDAQTLERSIRYALSQASVIRELDNKEKRYRSLFERSIDPIFLTDENFKFIDANVSMTSLFQHPRTKLLEMGLEDLFYYKEELETFRQILSENEQVKDFEVVFHNMKGDKMVCLLNCVFISDASTMSCCYQGIIHDLTMRKKAERELVMAEKLLMTGKIARTIAHEVRNPLTNLNLALEQLNEELPSNNSMELYTGIISRNANRIEQLISEMLNSSKPKELHLELIPVHEVIEEALTLILDRINLNKMQLVRKLNDQLPRVFIDKEKIKIALLNIFINAIEAMEPGKGVLTVETEKKDLKIIVKITDNGKGIAEDELDKLFDPFYTAKQGGMGLGLTTTQNILNSHNIGIEVSSQLQKGTQFSVILNLAE